MNVVFRFARTAAAGTAAMACACSAFAADLVFDGNGAPPPDAVGTGTWDATRANWFDGTGYRTWDNGGSDRAVFGKPGTISIGAPVTAGGLGFDAAGTYTLSGPHRLTLDNADIALASGATATISSQLAGAFRVTGPAVGQGTLRIASNNAGIFDGRAIVGHGATLSLGHVNALGTSHAAENLVIENGGRLEFGVAGTFRNDFTLTGGTVRIGTLNAGGTFSGRPTLAASTELIFGTRNNAAQQWTGVLADTGPHVLSFGVDAREGFGPTLSGANTYSGDTTLHSGVLTIANAGALSRNSALAFANTTGVPALLSFAFGGTYNATLGSGAGQVRWESSGGFRSPLGTTTVTLDGNAPLAWGVGHFVPDGAALQIGTGVVFTNAIDLGDQQRDLFGGGTISGALGGTAGLRLRSGVLTLSAANTWTGDTLVEARTGGPFGAQLHLGHAGALPGGIGTTGGKSRLVLDDGMLVLGEDSGDFLRGIGDGAHQVRFAGSGGFASASGVRTVDLGGAGETLAWTAPGFVPHGSALAFGGHAPGASMLFRNGLDLADGERTVQLAATSNGHNVPHRAVTLAGVVSNGSIVFSGFGEAALTGENTYAGRTVIGNGDVSTRIVVDRLADGGSVSGIGASTSEAANLVFGATGSNNQATLGYVGGAASTNRNFTMIGNAEILSDGTGALEWHGAPSLVAGNRTLRLGGANTDANVFAGTLADGGGILSVAKHGTGTWRLTGRNTFTGGVRIGSNVSGFTDGGTLEVETLGNAGEAGGLGINAGNNPARLSMFDGAVLRYVGEGEDTDRNISRGVQAATSDRANGIAIESGGTGALAWHGTIAMHATANPWLRLGGTHAGDNRLTSVLRDATQAISLAKEGSGTWGLFAANTYTGATEIVDGVLRLEHADAVAGGLGAEDADGSGIRLSGGLLGLTEASGDLTRRLDATNGRNGLAWIDGANGGFAAYGAPRVVDLGGTGATLAWGAAGFIGDAGTLLLGHRTADATLAFRNGLDFAGRERNVEVADGTHAIDAILGGALVGGGSSGLAKTGDGTLRITGDNTYAGRTCVQGGVLEVAGAGTLGRGDLVIDDNATLLLARDAVGTFANRIDGDGTLVQRGPGASVLTGHGSRIGRVQVEQGALAVDGSLDVAHVGIGEGVLRVAGLVQGRAGATAHIDAADGTRSAIVVDGSGALHAHGGLGDGDDLLDVAGTFDTGVGAFALGDGDDTLALRDRAAIGGQINGGAGDDQLVLERFSTTASRLAAFENVERMRLRDASEVALDTGLDFGGGTIDIDASSALFADRDARVIADVLNAGAIRANGASIAIAGDYAAAHGARLHVTVSPSSNSAGNLVVEGDVSGTTGVVFASDGTPGLSPASIRIVAAPNDIAGEGEFVALQARNGIVRLDGSPYAWTFGADSAKTGWFLRTDEHEQAPVLLPELPAYSVLPSIAAIATQDTHRIVLDRLAALRGHTDDCREDIATTRGRDRMQGACRGAWMATFGGELDVAANPGAAFRGNTRGMLAGSDRVFPSDAGTTLRAGAYAGVVRGDHSSSGANVAERVAVAPARMRSTSPMLGMYAGRTSAGGGFVDAHVTATRVSAKVHVADGFADTHSGSVLAMRLQAGRRFDSAGWSLEPQVELGVAARQWRDKVDAGGRHVAYVDDAVGTARIGLRLERTSQTGVRPWAAVAVGDSLGEATDALHLHAADGAVFTMPGHDLGLAATVDLGVEARVGEGLDLYGTMSAAERLRGSHVSQRQATLGVRWHW